MSWNLPIKLDPSTVAVGFPDPLLRGVLRTDGHHGLALGGNAHSVGGRLSTWRLVERWRVHAAWVPFLLPLWRMTMCNSYNQERKLNG